MKTRTLLIHAVAVLTLSSCSADGTDKSGNGDASATQILLKGDMKAGTRADYDKTQGTKLADGQKVYVWADDHVDKTSATNHDGDKIDYLKGWTLTSSASLLTGSAQYYSAAGNNLDVYAVHGNFNKAVVEGVTSWASFNDGSLTHSVLASQNTGDGYEQSDLLFARAHNLIRQDAPHTLTFNHLLSKIEVYLIAGTGLTDSDITNANVSVLGTRLSCGVSFDKTAVTGAIVTVSGSASDITARMSYRTDVQVTVAADTHNAYAFGEAVVVPQTLAAGTQLLKVRLANGIELYSAVPAGGALFEMGKKYVFNVTVNASSLALSATITDWTDGDTLNILAE